MSARDIFTTASDQLFGEQRAAFEQSLLQRLVDLTDEFTLRMAVSEALENALCEEESA